MTHAQRHAKRYVVDDATRKQDEAAIAALLEALEDFRPDRERPDFRAHNILGHGSQWKTPHSKID